MNLNKKAKEIHELFIEGIEAYCAQHFPYVCLGEKTVLKNGSIECTCGLVFERGQNEPKPKS